MHTRHRIETATQCRWHGMHSVTIWKWDQGLGPWHTHTHTHACTHAHPPHTHMHTHWFCFWPLKLITGSGTLANFQQVKQEQQNRLSHWSWPFVWKPKGQTGKSRQHHKMQISPMQFRQGNKRKIQCPHPWMEHRWWSNSPMETNASTMKHSMTNSSWLKYFLWQRAYLKPLLLSFLALLFV